MSVGWSKLSRKRKVILDAMPYLIDGHNLIGTGIIHGISLKDEDDEVKLVQLLRRYQSRVRTRLTVVFDRGVPGGYAHALSGGGVEVVFAGSGHSADDIIMARIRRSRNPAALRVVSSDRTIQQFAKAHGCRVISAADFAREVVRPLPAPAKDEDVHLSEEEIEEWLRLFGQNKR